MTSISISKFLKFFLPLSLAFVLLVFSLFSLISINKIYSEENLNIEAALANLIKQSVQEPLTFGDQVEVSRRLKVLVGDGVISDICTDSPNFLYLKCSPNLDLSSFEKTILKTPSMVDSFVFYIQFRHRSFENRFFWTLLPLLMISLLIFFLGYLIVTKYEQLLITDIKIFVDSLSNKKITTDFNSTEFNSIKKNLKVILEELSLVNVAKTKIELSRKLAHDIRSPLSTLNLISSQIQDSDIKQLQISVINQINQISEDLLKEVRQQSHKESSLPNLSIQQITFAQLFKELAKEYNLKSEKMHTNVEFKIESTIHNISKNAPAFLYSCLNNLIQNSIEATIDVKAAHIQIHASIFESFFIKIEITDNGIGIPAHILQHLGKKEISYGKKNIQSGNGIGVFSAYNQIRTAGGSMDFVSIENQKTTVSIILPVLLIK